MPEDITNEHSRVDICVSATTESLIESIIMKVISSPEKFAQIAEHIIHDLRSMAQPRVPVMSVQRRCSDKRTRLEERCRQYV